MKDITLLIAHADDEAIFLWPFLDRVKRIVCASSDQHNISRKWCSERGKCIRDVCRLIGADCIVSEANSEFYRKETRPSPDLKNHAIALAGYIRDAEIIATHNAWGEYGHLDHILCHHIARTVQAQTKCQVLVTDIAQEINWLPVRPWVQGRVSEWDEKQAWLPKHFHIDRPLFDRIKAIYDARGCWTWAWEPQSMCRMYSL